MISVCPPRLTSGPQPAHDARPHPHRVFMQQRPQRALRSDRTDGLGDRFTVQPFMPTATGESSCNNAQRRPDVRRHATWPQSWSQRENWEFLTHRSTTATAVANLNTPATLDSGGFRSDTCYVIRVTLRAGCGARADASSWKLIPRSSTGCMRGSRAMAER